MAKRPVSTKSDKGNRRFVAFLRGVNLGKRTAKSPQLIEAFSAVGLENVQTFLASGNVVFDSGRQDLDKLRAEIEMQLHKSLGFESTTFLRGLDQIAKTAETNPFTLNAGQLKDFTFHVAFLDKPAPQAMKKRLAVLRSDYDDFAFSGSELWWLCRGPKISDSKLFQGNKLEKAIEAPNTMRNLRTLQRLVAKFGGS